MKTAKGTRFEIINKTDSALKVELQYGMGVCYFDLFDWKKLGLRKSSCFYVSNLPKTDLYGNKLKHKFTSIEKAVDYLEEIKTSIK
jgi:hypothetical protein